MKQPHKHTVHLKPWPEDICSTHEDYLDWNRIMHLYKTAYYKGYPLTSDSTYDLLERMLMWVEEKHPEWITSDSVTQFVGYKLDNETNTI